MKNFLLIGLSYPDGIKQDETWIGFYDTFEEAESKVSGIIMSPQVLYNRGPRIGKVKTRSDIISATIYGEKYDSYNIVDLEKMSTHLDERVKRYEEDSEHL